MKLRILAAFCAAAFLMSAGAAKAAMFGTQEEIHKLMDVDITSQDNQPLYLAYKTSTFYAFAGVYIKDEGYVFGVRDKPDVYIETTPEEIAKFQASGLLPDPLPKYSLSFLDYALGYSLWIVLAIIAIVYLFSWLRKRGTPATPTPTPDAPAA
jgi:hypothetical protein